MRRAAVVGILLLATAVSCKSGPDLGIEIRIDRQELSNGLKIFLIEDHTAPVVSFQTWIGAGSLNEVPGSTGLAHLFEHLMFKGTKKFGAGSFFREFEAKGAQVNAFTTRDYTVYYEVVPAEMLPKAVEMEADRLRNLQLDQKLLDSERMVVLEERRLRVENSPEGKVQEALWASAFRDHPYGRPVIGTMEDLMSIQLENLTAFYNTYYQPSNTTLIVAGDFRKDELLELIRTHYGAYPKSVKPKLDVELEPEQTGERRLVLRDEVTSERFARAYHIPAARDADRYALDVLSNILFTGRNSRAYRRLVEDQKLLINVAGTSFTPMHPGLFIVSGMLRGAAKSEQAEAELDRLLAELSSSAPVTAEEVRTAVRQLLVEHVDGIRTPHGVGQLIGTVNAILGDPERFRTEAERYSKVTAEDVASVAKRYLVPNNRTVIIMRPEEGKKAKAEK